MEKFFKPRKRKSNIDLSGDSEPKEPKEKKRKKSIDDSIKRGAWTGFNAETIPDRMKLMQKYPPKRFDKQKISYTELMEIWSFSLSDKKAEIWHFCPWGMRETMTKKLKWDTFKARYVFTDFFFLFMHFFWCTGFAILKIGEKIDFTI